MAQTIVIDALHVTVRVPAGLPQRRAAAVRRAVFDPAFVRRVRQAVVAAVGQFPVLATARVSVSR